MVQKSRLCALIHEPPAKQLHITEVWSLDVTCLPRKSAERRGDVCKGHIRALLPGRSVRMEATGIQGGGLCTTESHSEHHLEAAYTSRSSRLQKGPLIHFEGCLPNLPTALYAPDSRKFPILRKHYRRTREAVPGVNISRNDDTTVPPIHLCCIQHHRTTSVCPRDQLVRDGSSITRWLTHSLK